MNPSLQRPARRQSGFTLIEIMVVVVILGILAAIVVPNIIGKADDARVTASKQGIQSVLGALDLYKLDNFSYPSTQQGLEALIAPPQGEPVARNWKGPYIKGGLPKDGWGQPFQYLNEGETLQVKSLGADGKPGGEGFAADLSN